ncbi:34404_t:CDS:1, partial [Gigaspora margarita]
LGIMLPDWKARKDVKEALRQRLFKDNQIKALVLDKEEKNLLLRKELNIVQKLKM